MAYVERDNQGNIIAVFDTEKASAQEFLAIDNPELLDFLANKASSDDARAALTTSDLSLVRVLEDLIYTLIDKNVILFTDLPLAAREKLANREKIRGHLNTLDNLMGDSEESLL
jgi:hypothetical protein